MIKYSEAVEIVKKEFTGLKSLSERVNILYSINRILAEDIYSDAPQPAFTNSSMDGYAVKFRKGILKWKVIGEISAGKFKNYKPESGEAVMIMTGSKMPDYTDTVIPVEHVIADKNEIIFNNKFRIAKYQNVRTSGEDIAKGSKVLQKGQVISTKHIQLAASCGKKTIKVYRKPKSGILVTGNELIDINEKPKADKVRASNLYSLLASVIESGLQPVNLGIVKDVKPLLKRIIINALRSELDILITSGGVSEGKYDYLPEIYKELGVNILFHKVNIKPAKPILFGIYKKKDKPVLVFGLPGNPVSCFVSFSLFIRNIYYSAILNDRYFNTKAVLADSLNKKDNKRHFIRGVMKEIKGLNYVLASGSQSSANTLGLSSANVLIEFPENAVTLKAGRIVDCIKI